MVPITVFTPTYNRVELLNRCFESMKNQTNKNFIWMIIDDGSTDLSASLCKSFCDKDKRFTYFYKKNEGVSTARNMGIENSRGESICFLDSDDTFSPDYLKHLSEDSADLVITGAKVYGTNTIYSQYETNRNIVVSADNINELIRLGGINVVWGKIFRKDILNN